LYVVLYLSDTRQTGIELRHNKFIDEVFNLYYSC
jgi:hypothetical protein